MRSRSDPRTGDCCANLLERFVALRTLKELAVDGFAALKTSRRAPLRFRSGARRRPDGTLAGRLILTFDEGHDYNQRALSDTCQG